MNKRKRILSIISIIFVLSTMFQIYPIRVEAGVVSLTLKIGSNHKEYTESGLFYSQSPNINIDIYAAANDGEICSIEYISPGGSSEAKTYEWTTAVNGLQYYTNRYGVYTITVKGKSGSGSKVPLIKTIKIDLQPSNTPTYSTQFVTQTMVVTAINGIQCKDSTGQYDVQHFIELGGSDDIPQEQRDEIASWPGINKDGKNYELTGYGIIRVYKDDGGEGTTLATLDSRNDLSKFQRYGFDPVSVDIFNARATMTLYYTAPYRGAVVVESFPEGLLGEIVLDENAANNSDYNIYTNRDKTVSINTVPKRKDGTVLSGYKLDMAKSTITSGRGTSAWDITEAKKVSKLLEAQKNGFYLTLDADRYDYLVDLYYIKEIDHPTGRFGLVANPKGKIVETTNINDNGEIKLDIKQGDDAAKHWSDYIDSQAPDNALAISINVSRDIPGMNLDTGLFPSDGTYVPIDKETLINYMKNGTQIAYNDSITGYPINEDQTVEFNYSAVVKIKIGTTKVTEITLDPNEGSDYISFYKPPAQTVNYISSPQVFSEIKQGVPLGEEFEAMAGVPTTRNLYFASGGSEFIVDIEAEYKNNGTATREYKSEFFSTECGWTMPEITGGYQNDSPPSQPQARTKTDASGASFTENVRLESAQYIKGYTTGEHPSPIYGTKYRWVQEGHAAHQVGGYSDTWTQSVTYDYMKIKKVKVWKIQSSKVNGMTTILGTNEVTASIVKGDPNVFCNIAGTENSAGGRLRYSLETGQNDYVYWNEGLSDNTHANTNVGPVNEQAKFNERRNTMTNVTAVSDFLILQTSSGDQSVLYFQKTSSDAKTTDPLAVPKTSKEEMWDNNPLSAAKWSVNQINVGSYNGKYAMPSAKYSFGGGAQIPTMLDNFPVSGNPRLARPSGPLRLQQTELNIIDTLRNGEYITGTSDVFYRVIVDRGTGTTPYSLDYNAKYGDDGEEFTSTYSPAHSKVNDIVIHNPVSAEQAMILPMDKSRDMRTEGSAIGGNLQPAEIETTRELDPNHPKQNLIYNGDCEILGRNGYPLTWNQWASISDGRTNFTPRTNDPYWTISGSHTFEINTPNKAMNSGTNYVATIYKDLPADSRTRYHFSAKMEAHRCDGYVYFDMYNSKGVITRTVWTNWIKDVSVPTDVSADFTTDADTTRIRIHIVKGYSVYDITNLYDYLFADDLILNNLDKNTWIPYEAVYEEQTVANPDYVPPAPVDSTFNYTGGEQVFTAPATGEYTIDMYGAQGGNGAGGYGGHASGKITLNKDEKLYVMVGGTAGFNGGGAGSSGYSNSCGGGASDVRKISGNLSSRLIVAGGGGGNGPERGGNGGGDVGGIGAKRCGTPGEGGTQTAGGNGYEQGSFGQGGRSASTPASGAGGGGWYGGGSGRTDYPSYYDNDDSGGGGGSGYIAATVTNGVNTQSTRTGNGVVRITSPALPATQPQYITKKVLAARQPASGPPDSWYHMVTRIIESDAASPIPDLGSFSAGNFINMDYGFYVYFPNIGNFRGNDALGIAATSPERGKGYTAAMNTTEWTKYKSVTFDFNVIYDGVAYKAGKEISLDINKDMFEFYCVLSNYEAKSAKYTFKVIANNSPVNAVDNDKMTNRVRYSQLAAKHSGIKNMNVDVLGRIGNLVIEDTGDFRFSNFFKKPTSDGTWFVPNVVKNVDTTQQNFIFGSQYDIRGVPVSQGTNFLNTYGMLGHMGQNPVALPLSPEKNNLTPLQRQPVRIGYNVFADIQTIGNYYDNMTIKMHYYSLDLTNGAITPVDVYMSVNGQYKPINLHGNTDMSKIYNFNYGFTLDTEYGRRNIGDSESMLTNIAGSAYRIGGPESKYHTIGNAQIINLNQYNRTLIGTNETYGQNKNPGKVFSSGLFNVQAQRWHFTYGLPSSAVVVPSGEAFSDDAVKALRNNNRVILATADIIATGNKYLLQYKPQEGNGSISLGGKTFDLNIIPHVVLSVFSESKSSADDLEVTGTH